MKNAMKKIMGLLLVAVLLVSVVPFQALADEVDTISLILTIDGTQVFDDARTLEGGKSSSTAGSLAWYWYLKDEWESGKITKEITYNSVTVNGVAANGAAIKDTVVRLGDDVVVDVSVKTVTPPEANPADAPETKTTPAGTTAPEANPAGSTPPATNETTAPAPTETTAPDADAGIDNQAGASATIKVNIKVETDGVKKDVKSFELAPTNGKYAEVGDILTYGWNKDWKSAYTFDHAWSKERQKNLSLTDIVNVDDTLSFLLKTGSNGGNGGSSSGSGSSGSGSTTNKFPYKVYLHVYLNNNIGEPDRNINITNSLATDGVVSMSEVKNKIPDYYKAKNSNGISYDGLYLAKGNWVKDYVTDANKYEKLNDVDVRTGEEYVHINVMITNATAKTTSTADTSNPKTGDAIFMTITVMGLSAAALTGLFFYDKKRKAL